MQNKTTARIFEEKFKIHTYEVDLHNKLTIQSLAQYLQEAASNHAALLGFGVEFLLKNNRTWVLSRLGIEIKNSIPLGETITIKTWPADTEKLFYIRDFLIESSNGDIIGRATSYWIFLDTELRRPVHPSRGEVIFNYGDNSRAFERSLDKIQTQKKAVPSKSFHVRYSDLDLNMHVNNVRYIEWGMEGIEPDYRKSNAPISLEINFLSEAKYADIVKLTMENLAGNKFLHSLYIGNSEICRIQSAWKSM